MYSTTHVAQGVPNALPLFAKTQSAASYVHTAVLKSYLGEQAAFVYSSLYSYSRLTFQQLGQRTHLKPRLLKQLLAGLIQLGCVVFTLDKPSLGSKKTITYYEISEEGCWKLVYADEVLSVIGEKYGEMCAEVIQNIIISGHLTLGDYLRTSNENKAEIKKSFIKLVDDKWIIPLKKQETLSQKAIFSECVLQATKEYNSQSINGASSGSGMGNNQNGRDGKPKTISQMKRAQGIKEIAKEKFIQRMMDQEQIDKLYSYRVDGGEDDDEDDGYNNGSLDITKDSNSNSDVKGLNPNLPLTLNFERVLKHIRSEHLVSTAIHRLGAVTAKVYEIVLKRIEERSRNIRLAEDSADKLVAGVAISMGNITSATMGLSTGAVQAMTSGLCGTTQGYDPSSGGDLERVYELKDQERGLNFNAVDILKEIKKRAPKLLADIKGTISDGNDDVSLGMKRKNVEVKEENQSKKIRLDTIKFEEDDDEGDEDDEDTKMMSMVLQHLKLLTTDIHLPFLMESNPGSYYVPMTLLQSKLPVYELKQQLRIIVGAKSLRIMNCIEKKRLIDEKSISKEVLMKEVDVRRVLSGLLKLGLIEIQEIPRTADRSAIRAAFAYRVCSGPGMLRGSHSGIGRSNNKGAYLSSMEIVGKCMMHSMGEAIDSLITMRSDNKILLDKVSRDDVRGKEGELLLEGEIKQLKMVMDQERLALAQWTRLRTMGELFWFFKGV